MTDLCNKPSRSSPSHAAAPAAPPAFPLSGTDRTLPSAERQRILIVEDDGVLAAAMAIGLERAGYDAAIASDPEQALQALAVMPDSWSVVITDHQLPKMTGLALFRHIRRLRPNLPVIFHSGSLDPVLEKSAREQGASEFLHKPVTPADLAAAVGAVIIREFAKNEGS